MIIRRRHPHRMDLPRLQPYATPTHRSMPGLPVGVRAGAALARHKQRTAGAGPGPPACVTPAVAGSLN